jgi:23S rRNA (pseudouridine1915-N3)-methyltransferase
MPAWVDAGFADYAGRLRGDFRLELTEIPLGERGSGDVRRAVETEGRRMLAAAGDRAHLVALQVGGRALSTSQLARWLEERAREGQTPVFCIGGPDGLAPAVDALAQLRWSLSALTLPHGLARVVVAEALYRAVSLNKGLPYHRA